MKVPSGWTTLAVAPDARTIALHSGKSVVILDAVTGKELKQLGGHEPFVMSVAFIDGGKKVAVGSVDHQLHLWDVADGRKILQFSFRRNRGRTGPGAAADDGDGLPSYTTAISPDNRLIAYGSQDKYLALLELATGREIACFINLPDSPCPMVFSPDGRTLAWGGWNDSPVRLMETATGKERRRLLGHKGRVVSLAYSTDGKMLVSGSIDTTALVWNLIGRHELGAKPPLSAKELNGCWDDLAGEDAARAFQAIRRLAGDPARAIPFLDKLLQPVPPVDNKDLARLIMELESETFAVREKAARELESLGEIAVSACRIALKDQAAIEVRRRLERVLDKQEQHARNPSADLLRTLRAMEILELAGNTEARKVLARMSQGADEARVTVDAKATLERLVRAGNGR